MTDAITLRPATEADIPVLIDIFDSAFANSLLTKHCFPRGDPESDASNMTLITNSLPEIMAAVDPGTEAIIGWARWCRRESPPPKPTFTNDMYPVNGNQDLARRFFEANTEKGGRIVAGRPVWFLSLLVVRPEYQGRGIGGMLVRYGTDLADADGWIASVNASSDGVRVYERCGFVTRETSEFENGLTTYHMLREKRGGETTS